MYKILLSSGLSFLITFFSIPAIIRIAKAKKLFAPSNNPNNSKSLIPAFGGVAIFAGFAGSILLFIKSNDFPLLQFFLVSLMIVFFLGLKEDIQILSFSKKITGQIIASFILVYFGGFQINHSGGLFGLNEISTVSNILISFIVVMIISNSFIFMSSVDGLSGSFGMLSALIFGCYFYFIGNMSFSIIAFSLAAALMSFLFFNFSPAKIYIGSTGTLLIGLVHSVLFIKFINTSENTSAPFAVSSYSAIAFAILMFPLFETFKSFVIRVICNKKSFNPDKNLTHHLLNEMGISNKNIIIILVLANLSIVILAFILNNIGSAFLFVIIIAIGSAASFIVYGKNEKLLNEKELLPFSNSHPEIIKSTKFLNIYSETVDAD